MESHFRGFPKRAAGRSETASSTGPGYLHKGQLQGFGVNIGTDLDVSDSHSKKGSQRTTFQNLQTKVQLSLAQTGGPP